MEIGEKRELVRPELQSRTRFRNRGRAKREECGEVGSKAKRKNSTIKMFVAF